MQWQNSTHAHLHDPAMHSLHLGTAARPRWFGFACSYNGAAMRGNVTNIGQAARRQECSQAAAHHAAVSEGKQPSAVPSRVTVWQTAKAALLAAIDRAAKLVMPHSEVDEGNATLVDDRVGTGQGQVLSERAGVDDRATGNQGGVLFGEGGDKRD